MRRQSNHYWEKARIFHLERSLSRKICGAKIRQGNKPCFKHVRHHINAKHTFEDLRNADAIKDLSNSHCKV